MGRKARARARRRARWWGAHAASAPEPRQARTEGREGTAEGEGKDAIHTYILDHSYSIYTCIYPWEEELIPPFPLGLGDKL